MENEISESSGDVRPFVSVNTCGVPRGHETAAAAIAAHLEDVGGKWNLFGHQENYIRAALEVRGEYLFEHSTSDSSPILAAVFDNRRDRLAVHHFTNRHLYGRVNSVAYVQKAGAAWGARTGPRVGDYVTDAAGVLSRFTFATGDGFQAGGGQGMGFHMGKGGFASYSGSLTRAIPLERLHDTGETRAAAFWFFLDGWAGAHRGVTFQLPCRMFSEVTP